MYSLTMTNPQGASEGSIHATPQSVLARKNTWQLAGMTARVINEDTHRLIHDGPAFTLSLRSFYADICDKLGFRAYQRFVRLTSSGAIDFTAGKPEEVRALAAAATRNGFKLSAKLKRFIKQQGWTLPVAQEVR